MEPRPREVVISAVCLRVCGYRFVCRVPNSAGLGDGRQPVSRNRGSNSARPRPARIHFRALSVRSPSGVCWGHPESIRGTTASRFDVGLRASARHRSPFHRAHGFRGSHVAKRTPGIQRVCRAHALSLASRSVVSVRIFLVALPDPSPTREPRDSVPPARLTRSPARHMLPRHPTNFPSTSSLICRVDNSLEPVPREARVTSQSEA